MGSLLGFVEIKRPWVQRLPIVPDEQGLAASLQSKERLWPLEGVFQPRIWRPRSCSPVLLLLGRRCTLTSATAAMSVLFPSRLLTRSMILSVMSLMGFSSSPISSADCRRRHTINAKHHIRCTGEPAIYKPSQAAKALVAFNI